MSRLFLVVVLALGGCEDAPTSVDQGGNLNGDVIVNAVHDLGGDGP